MKIPLQHTTGNAPTHPRFEYSLQHYEDHTITCTSRHHRHITHPFQAVTRSSSLRNSDDISSGAATTRNINMAAWWAHLLAYFLLGLFSATETKKNHAVPTYFKRINPDGSLIDAGNLKTRVEFANPTRRDFSTGVILEVNPSLVENSTTVNVSWSGIQVPNSTDIIAFYCPEEDHPDHYLDLFYVTDSPSYVFGYGWRQVTVHNMRTSCEFRYYQEKHIQVATSNVLEFKGGKNAPLQGHLALTGDPTQMRVMWVSGTGKIIVVPFI